MNKFNALVLKAHGTNCEIESSWVLKKAGFKPDIVHINELQENSSILNNYSFVLVPGGFSFGDYTGSGRIVASIIGDRLKRDFESFIENGKLILGICNGFQILVKSGLLPNISGAWEQEVSLIFNDSHQYEDRWVHLKVTENSAFTKNMPDIIELPVAHAEGKFVYGSKTDISGLTVMRYCDREGNVTSEYPLNPNGAMESIAAITNKKGTILGMMPHPERFARKRNYRQIDNSVEPYGKYLFENAYKYVKEEL